MCTVEKVSQRRERENLLNQNLTTCAYVYLGNWNNADRISDFETIYIIQ